MAQPNSAEQCRTVRLGCIVLQHLHSIVNSLLVYLCSIHLWYIICMISCRRIIFIIKYQALQQFTDLIQNPLYLFQLWTEFETDYTTEISVKFRFRECIECPNYMMYNIFYFAVTSKLRKLKIVENLNFYILSETDFYADSNGANRSKIGSQLNHI